MLLRLYSQSLLCCSILLYSILFFLYDTQLSVHFLFLIPIEGSIPQATDRFKTAFIVARCFFWLQEGLTLPRHSIAEHIVLPTVLCLCIFVCKYTCVCTYASLHTCVLFVLQIEVSSLPRRASWGACCILTLFFLVIRHFALLNNESCSMYLFVVF